MSNDKIVIPGKPSWQQTMLRIKDPEKSLRFYRDLMGMTLIDTLEFPQYDFTLYFLMTLPSSESYDLTPGTQAAHDYLWSTPGTVLELTHNHGSETDTTTKYHPGNQEGDGFGHVAFNTDNVEQACEELEAQGVTFKKKPNEGRMMGIAFAYDPDGYWVEILKRREGSDVPSRQIGKKFNFSQTMLRVKDPAKTVQFYEALGMKLVRQKNYGDFTNSFMVSGEAPEAKDLTGQSEDDDAAKARLSAFVSPVLELTHNHGTETQEDFRHFSGNEDDRKGFGHIGFIVDDVYAACEAIAKFGYGFKKEPDGGSMKGLAFAYDPDGYWVEIVKRGGMDFGDKRKDA